MAQIEEHQDTITVEINAMRNQRATLRVATTVAPRAELHVSSSSNVGPESWTPSSTRWVSASICAKDTITPIAALGGRVELAFTRDLACGQ
jgi:hypothetical protein